MKLYFLFIFANIGFTTCIFRITIFNRLIKKSILR